MTEITSLGDRMKNYEQEYNTELPKNHYYIVRLDGVSFSKFTSSFHKPFDRTFILAMVATMNDLMNKFHPKTGYCHSDEITLIFDKCNEENQNHMYNGRVTKLCSVIAGYCSVRFNYNLSILIKNDEYPTTFVNKIKRFEQCFDARILSFEELGEVTNHMIWRSIHDCERNAVQTYAHHTFGHKAIHKKDTVEMKQMLMEKDTNWDTIPMYIKHGVYCKKVLVEKETDQGSCTRGVLVNKCFKICYNETNNQMLINKYWPDDCQLENFVIEL